MSERNKYMVGDIKVDGLEPTDEFKEYAKLERMGKETIEDSKRLLDKPYKIKA